MPKILKYLLIGFASIMVLLGAALAIVAATFNPNDYKPDIIKLVQDKTQRSLSIPGDIKLTYYPSIGADLGEIAISERNGNGEFASIKRAKLSLSLMPILSKQFVVDQVILDGLVIDIHRFADGKSNFDDLLGKNEDASKDSAPEEEASQQVKLDIGGISITGASINYTDDTAKRKVSVSNLGISTGPIALGKKSAVSLAAEIAGNNPTLGLKVAVKGDLTIGQANTLLENLDFTLNGAAADFQDVKIQFLAKSFEASSSELKIPELALKAIVRQGGKALELDSTGGGSVDLVGQGAQLALAGKLDGNTFSAKLGLKEFAQPQYNFDVTIDNLDMDRYSAKGASAETAATTGGEQPLDLSALESLIAKGQINVKALKVANIRASDVRFELRSANGMVLINPLTASLYGGTVTGSLSATASNPPRFTAKQSLQRVSIGSLLNDAIDSQPIDGNGNVEIDITTVGGVTSQLKKGLSGTAKLELKDGAINGINLADTIRTAKAKLGQLKGGSGAPQQGTTSAQEKTDFSELAASFVIRQGVARNDDLSVKTPLFRVGGTGDIDIGSNRLDYTVKATVVPSLEGQGGPEIQEMKGLTVPVKLSGPFSTISWKIDFSGVASDLLKGKVDERKAQIKAQAQKQIDAQKDNLQEQLKSQLKGLFGR